ncbi:putative bifunctional diguanylate cyclase/phosphodiesterase [Noviherbaspirillum massiliense]|uniref:putative bifunctional diguanylate cyclase/phosphodiesterase n=1 Tax=Noviherbaspirillum massiliense TaxID=1465823 RepID=UPI0003104E79|nr:GGDEF and EAL domain-containing protein [Noviherbaspirillum massiliense]
MPLSENPAGRPLEDGSKAGIPKPDGEVLPVTETCLREILDNLNPSILVALLTVDGRVTYVNQTALEIVDRDLKDVLFEPFPSTPWWQFSGTARARLAEAIRKAGTGQSSHFEHMLRDHEGKPRAMDFWLHALFNPEGRVVALVASAQDITERMLAENALRRTQFAVDHAYGAMFELGMDGRLQYANDAACRLVGYSREELLKLSIGQIDIELEGANWQSRWDRLKSEGSLRFESRFRRRDGRDIPVDVATVYLEHEGQQYGFAYVEDISERKAARERIEHITYYDALTGLPNRALLNDRLRQAIQFAALHRLRPGILCIGLDRFKLVNDTLGSARGDEVLRIAARRIAGCVRSVDTVARAGSDEFVILLADGQEVRCDPGATASCILEAFQAPMDVPGHQLFVSCSIGLALYPEGGTDPDELLKNAYAAMQRAKAYGGGSMSTYSSATSRRDTERLALEAALRRASERSELRLFYQPQVDLDSGRIVSAEALLRWHPPHREMVAPSRFIPIAEETGLIIPIGEWALRSACGRIKAWCQPGSALKQIAVNLSARQFRNRNLVRMVAGLLEEFGIDPGCLELELTESMLMEDIETTTRTMAELKDLGVRMALDDFGTGYSSLSYLRRFPIDALKIDQSFIREIATDRNSAAISEGIITLGRSMGLSVIAEGVENEDQFAALQASGCDIGQGNLFSRPLPAEEFSGLLAQAPPFAGHAGREGAAGRPM